MEVFVRVICQDLECLREFERRLRKAFEVVKTGQLPAKEGGWKAYYTILLSDRNDRRD